MSMSSEQLLKRASRLESQAERLKMNSGHDVFLRVSSLLQEVSNLREWAKYGCLVGRPHSTWTP
jgi:hypothetical protein